MPHALVAQPAAKRSYAGSAFGGLGYRRRASPEYVVGGTIAVCVAVYLFKESAQLDFDKPNEYLRRQRDWNGFELLQQNFVLSRQNVDEGRWWTLITHTFTHFSPLHLAANMMTLWYIGRPIVLFYGAPTYALVWLSAGVGSGALSIYWSDIINQAVKRKIIQKPFWVQPYRPDGAVGAVGASGSILGMIGVEACVFPGQRLWPLGFVAFSILCLENDWLPQFGHKAHVGGMAIGATWWLLFLRRRRGW
jgi:membrane associated rhomboid family serine protease